MTAALFGIGVGIGVGVGLCITQTAAWWAIGILATALLLAGLHILFSASFHTLPMQIEHQQQASSINGAVS